ncbi:MAG: mechanosensitive ion channel [Saprospiraceae bacterium]|nr:mechanosensitive ion channel [Bacteroidia bacterium]NNE13427.1 mechanosensitive ion channel [Saprospiraceae bacterium]NNL93796.1 mechanosensitive ion channel [Saprospiraceae bacterium]
MKAFFDTILFNLGNKEITVSQLVIFLLLISAFAVIYKLIISRLIPILDKSENTTLANYKGLRPLITFLLLIGFVFSTIYTLNLDYQFDISEKFKPSLSLIVKTLFVLQLIRILDWLVNSLIIEKYYNNKRSIVNAKKLSEARRTVHYIFYIIVIIYFIRHLGLDFVVYNGKINKNPVPIYLSNIFIAILIFFVTRLAIWIVTEIFLRNIYKTKDIEVGSRFAINQLIKYVVYIIGFVFALDVIGINMTLLLGGAAALLVGIGLGLQQTFNDFISGIVLLFERSVSVGDILEFENTVGTVKKIGLRSSIVETRGHVSIIVPNHLLVNEKIQNWTHFNNKVRFDIPVGVAYGTDTALVKKLLVESVEKNPSVLKLPVPFVRFENFGDSSLDFNLYFFSKEYIAIEDIKSDIRLEIDRLFREHNISIPFPQRDVNLKKG